MSKVNNYLITFGDVATMGFTSKASYPGGYNANKIMTKGEVDTYWFVDTNVTAYAGYTSLRCPRYQDLQNTTTTSTTTTTTTTAAGPCQLSLSPSNVDGATACDNWNNVIDRTAYYALYYPCSATNGQQLYTDSGLTTLIPNGWYSDGTNYFQVVGGNGTLINSTACPGPTTTTTSTTSTTTTTTTSTTTTTTTIPPTTEPPTTSTTTTSTTTTTTTTAAPSYTQVVRFKAGTSVTCITGGALTWIYLNSSDYSTYVANGNLLSIGMNLYSDSAGTAWYQSANPKVNDTANLVVWNIVGGMIDSIYNSC
jgi:hypothetical protein